MSKPLYSTTDPSPSTRNSATGPAAERWYRQALTIDKKLGNRPDMALSFAQLGILAEARGWVEEAME